MTSTPAVEVDELRQHAERVRIALEAMPISKRCASLQHFPREGSGDASLLLGAYLGDHLFHGFEYVVGERGNKQEDTWASHAWLRRGALVLHITADRFADAPSAVIVSEPSSWHDDTFRIQRPPEPADFRIYTGPGLLHVVYARLLQHLPPL